MKEYFLSSQGFAVDVEAEGDTEKREPGVPRGEDGARVTKRERGRAREIDAEVVVG